MCALDHPSLRPKNHGATKRWLKIGVKQVDVFTDTPLTGNPVGVILDASGLTDQQLEAIAREMAVPATAFILPPSTAAAHVRIRVYTPQAEVPLLGHAAIASFHALAEDRMLGMDQPGTYKFDVEVKSGIMPVRVEKRSDATECYLSLPTPEFIRAGQFKLDAMRILNIALEEFESRMPIVVAGALYVPIRRLHTIFSMRPNFFAMSQFLINKNLTGLCAFTLETVDRTSTVHSRYFSPTAVVNEDPVTGSANGPLGVYLFERGELQDDDGKVVLIGEQGDAIGRKGRVTVTLMVQGSAVVSLEVGGRAITSLKGEMFY
jgi:trans-2,3-dihydro-3-hydroxyanthranilate isomerase